MSDIKKQATLGRFFGASTTVAKQPLSLQASSSHSKKGSTIQPNPSSNPSLRPSGDCKPHGSPTHTAEESDPPSHDPQSPRPLRKQSKRRIIQSDSESSPEQDDPMPSTPKKTKGNKQIPNHLYIRLLFQKDQTLPTARPDKSCKKAKDTLSQSKTLPIAEVSSVKQPDTESKLVEGNSVLYSVLCEVFADIEGTTKRLEIQSYLAKFFIK
ncbi:hypothetical protein BASA62_003525 [Batrachochytrium salamandrivorans]|nr:hypothetical protein BASA62_003525 [Batrachochytrium salamandrivorans]